MMPVLELESLSKSYGAKPVLDGVDLKVAPGEIIGLFGSNGSGKSTLLRIAAGALRATSGRVRVRGVTGYVAQKFGLYSDLTVEENLFFFAKCYGAPGAQARDRVEGTLDRLGLRPFRGEIAGELSHGWRQRLAVAAALTHSPDVLLLDEATSGLDPAARASLWEVLSNYAGAGGAILHATHFSDEAARCSRTARVQSGKLEEMVFG